MELVAVNNSEVITELSDPNMSDNRFMVANTTLNSLPASEREVYYPCFQ